MDLLRGDAAARVELPLQQVHDLLHLCLPLLALHEARHQVHHRWRRRQRGLRGLLLQQDLLVVDLLLPAPLGRLLALLLLLLTRREHLGRRLGLVAPVAGAPLLEVDVAAGGAPGGAQDEGEGWGSAWLG